jgi:hypothetical protein
LNLKAIPLLEIPNLHHTISANPIVLAGKVAKAIRVSILIQVKLTIVLKKFLF